MKIYISFGQSHVHVVNGKTFDKDSVCEIECIDVLDGREIAFEVFGDKFFTSYTEEYIKDKMHYFPCGIIPLVGKSQ